MTSFLSFFLFSVETFDRRKNRPTDDRRRPELLRRQRRTLLEDGRQPRQRRNPDPGPGRGLQLHVVGNLRRTKRARILRPRVRPLEVDQHVHPKGPSLHLFVQIQRQTAILVGICNSIFYCQNRAIITKIYIDLLLLSIGHLFEHLKWAPGIVTNAEFLVIQSKLFSNIAKFVSNDFWHFVFWSFSWEYNSSVVVENRQSAAPKHQQVVTLIRPGDDSPGFLLQRKSNISKQIFTVRVTFILKFYSWHLI